jgi:hypothetical protein
MKTTLYILNTVISESTVRSILYDVCDTCTKLEIRSLDRDQELVSIVSLPQNASP